MSDYKKINKLFYKNLDIEVTRRCNMKCAHCMRGKAENHTITKEVVDATLDNVRGIATLLLTGGEPFLEPEMIDYIFQGIIKRKIPVMSINLVTNGTIKDECIAKSFNDITNYIVNRLAKTEEEKKNMRAIGRITVSNDDFHEKVDIIDTLKFYREHLNKHTIVVRETQKKDGVEEILCAGNAKTLKLNDNQKFRYKVTPYRISLLKGDKILPDGIETCVMIGYDGKVLIGDDCSYEKQDRNNYGNILQKSMSQLLAEKAFCEPFTQKEARTHDMIYTIYKNKEFEVGNINYDEDFCKMFLQTFDSIYCERERIHKAFPEATYEEIVDVAYHDMNLSLKESCGEDADFRRIDNMEWFNTSKEESEKVCQAFKDKYRLDALLWYLFKPKDLSVKPVPDNVTGERYRRFSV